MYSMYKIFPKYKVITDNKIIIIMIQQFVRLRNMSMKSLQGRCTPSSCNECRTASDDRRPMDQAHGLEMVEG